MKQYRTISLCFNRLGIKILILTYISPSVTEGASIVQERLCRSDEEEKDVIEKDASFYDVLVDLSVRLEEDVHCKGSDDDEEWSHLQ